MEGEEKKNHFRAPVADTYRRKTPFSQLLDHMAKVRECIDILGEGLIKYYQGDYQNFSKLSKKISEIEHEADLIKSNLRNHLPSSLFMPVDKGKFMWAIREQDAILDHADNLVHMLNMRRTKIPEKLQPLFISHSKKVMKTVGAMEKAVENIKDLVETSFVKREREQTKEFIYQVHELEYQADKKKYDMTKGIYELEKDLTPMDVYHLLKIADWVDDIADHAENVADWLRAMIAK
ncbi:MAG: TIGR00153 family protein [Candidatus Thermoplasmatota archaeon]|nr:TIGR00153 family protein [Candidatus Thermoplasmatota archaeon]MBS3801887.1 TIGR00153 family protein [Candidatus Thermoplasmatota archaeon]